MAAAASDVSDDRAVAPTLNHAPEKPPWRRRREQGFVTSATVVAGGAKLFGMIATRLAQKSTTSASTIALYLSPKLSRHMRSDAAGIIGDVVVRGEAGADCGRLLRLDGFIGSIRLDPAAWEKPHGKGDQETLFGEDAWLAEQKSLSAAELLSPGSFVQAEGREGTALAAAIERETAWLDIAGQGRLSLVLDWTWLTSGLGQLIDALREAHRPIAVAFADPLDPLGHDGAVEGMIALLANVVNVMVHRADAGALGAVSRGAPVGAVGTGGSVRHAVAPGRRAGGSGITTPAAFVTQLLGWKHPSVLVRLPERVKPVCYLDCCKGQALDRFEFESPTSELYRHNHTALASLSRRLLDVAEADRAAWFKELAAMAVSEYQRIAMDGKQPFPTSPQITAWARS